MGRFLTALLATLGLIITAQPAYAANNPGSCSLPGGVVQINVKEQPGEGDVDYISISSPVQLDVSGDRTRATSYITPDYSWPILTDYAFSAPVDGDGFWNYRVEVDHTDGWIQHVYVTIEKYGSSSECGTNIYI